MTLAPDREPEGHVEAAAPRETEMPELLGLLHEVGAATVERRYARGEVIFGEGDPANALYVLTEGVVKLSRSYTDPVH